MGGTSDMMQRLMGGVGIGAGAVATAMGQPEIGIPMMASSISSEANPNPNQSPLQAGIGGAANTATAFSGMPSGVNPQMLSSLLGGRTQQAQAQPPPPTPAMRPPLTMQNAPQQAATPQMQPGPQIPQQAAQWPPTSLTPQQRAMILQAIGGSQ